MSDDARLRMSASFCSLVRRSERPAFRCRMTLLLHVVGRRSGGPARRRSPIEDPHTITVLFVPHPEIQSFTLEEVSDLLERLLAEVLDLQTLVLRLPDEIAERPDVRVLERVDRAHGELEVVDRRPEQL